MNAEFLTALDELEKEKNISKDVLIEAIESALVSAYKKTYGTSQNVRVNINRDSGDIEILMRRDVVGEVYDDMCEISLEEALEIDPRYEIGDVVEYQVTPKDFGRIAAQTAKQVVVQRIREAERGMVYDDYIERQGDLITGVVQRVYKDTLYISLGRTEGILPANEQVRTEHFDVNDRLKLYIMDVRKTNKGPQVYLSRSHPGLVKKLFEMEVPEIQDGTVEIVSIAREAGSRTKMAVYTEDENVDPVGSCVGPRGVRVQAVCDELFDEKIDIIPWSYDPEVLIANVLAPSQVEEVFINEDTRSAIVVVPDSQLSLAIGKEGQNVRLAVKLSGWKIDIKSHSQYFNDGGFTEVGDDEEPEDAEPVNETEAAASAADSDGIVELDVEEETAGVENED